MDEQKIKPSWKAFYPQFCAMAACLAAVSVISVKWIPSGYDKWLWLVCLLVLIYIAGDVVYKRNSVLLIVRPDKIALERGIIGRQSIEISARNIRTIRVNQSVMQRILNVGDIRVASSGTDAYEITALRMPGPHEIREAMHLNERAAVQEEEREE